ncbi:methylated-DNA--[protein]-cysteine S-methyltransferase [Pseudohongiella sp.]|uniref:methylated-DNA--[protein]-cysteine S-methyltransferase n=1 Tax=marine sediment metagenome TaxID=412755 RepID=A0A0F9YAG2_9ZZZZ|nr:methylated-DNA--[protein]-cysteine S-methyltransferase [Pseudohongiella sp.]HDZ08017.1 methylated-DNA--[protein]-cysteine S-methyltransferase [Pseudohongiella sp.]HEA64140.1 methylated-DNA--[protein]-cysteine S-methyltransferase [Pseudohongiella sp.]
MSTSAYHSNLPSPLGVLMLTSDGNALTGLYMENQKHRPELPVHSVQDDSRFTAVRQQLMAYFAGELQTFDVCLDAAGTAFQQRVWQALTAIPFGATESYGGLAARLGKPSASRAVGLANGRNPIGIIVPCHRVLGASGALTGYGGGLARKQWLLAHERTQSDR